VPFFQGCKQNFGFHVPESYLFYHIGFAASRSVGLRVREEYNLPIGAYVYWLKKKSKSLSVFQVRS